jgi:hypothetical protein
MGSYSKVEKQIAKLKAATPEAQEKAILKIIKTNEDELLDVNRSQLLEGIDADGKRLRRYRNPKYAALKRTMNSKGVTDLRFTGRLYDAMFLDASKFAVIYDSKDSKAPMLKQKYGNIFGITKQNEEMVAGEILGDQIIIYYAGLFQI